MLDLTLFVALLYFIYLCSYVRTERSLVFNNV